MEDYINIETFATTVAKDKIHQKRNNPLWGILALAAGIALVVICLRTHCGDALRMTMLSIGIITAIVGAGILVFRISGQHYVCTATGSPMKSYKRYIDGDSRQRCKDNIASGDIKGLALATTVPSSNTLLHIIVSRDRHYALLQLEEYVPHNFVPSSPVVEINGDDVETLMHLIK